MRPIPWATEKSGYAHLQLERWGMFLLTERKEYSGRRTLDRAPIYCGRHRVIPLHVTCVAKSATQFFCPANMLTL